MWHEREARDHVSLLRVMWCPNQCHTQQNPIRYEKRKWKQETLYSFGNERYNRFDPYKIFAISNTLFLYYLPLLYDTQEHPNPNTTLPNNAVAFAKMVTLSRNMLVMA